MARQLLFSIAAYGYLEETFATRGAYERGTLERRTFPDGERYLRVTEDTRGRDVVLLAGTPTDLDWLELYDLGCALSRGGARSLAIVMPYFGCATMERAVLPGEVVTAKTRARLVSAIPPCEAGTRIILFDLHTDGIEFYFSDGHITRHVYGAPVVTRAIGRRMHGRAFVLGATDAGRAKWVESLARRLGVEPAFVYKRRDASTGKLTTTGINADVRGREVVVYDDMIRTGSSLLQAGQAYLQAGATMVHAVTSHLVLPGDALENIERAGVFASVSGSDSHPGSQKLSARHPGDVFSIVNLLVDAVGQA